MSAVKFSAGTMSKIIPASRCGGAEIVHDSPDKFTKLRAAMQGQSLDCDTYTRLIVSGRLWMTDAEFEWRTNLPIINKMRGDVLIAGLGIGFILPPLVERCNSITVIENNNDVISLVSPHFPTVKVIAADARKWVAPRKSFDFIYFDIWADVPNSDNWEDIKTLKRRYRPALKSGGWMAAWCERYARR